MLQAVSFPIRQECPPGACVCGRENLSDSSPDDIRILKLTQAEEKKLIARIEDISSYADLKKIGERMREHLGVELLITPGNREVRTVRGLNIQLMERPGLCKKTRQTVPAAIRRCLDRNPEIVYAILDAHDLFGQA
jgi:hypothetical protein